MTMVVAQTDFMLSRNSIFLVGAILLLVETIVGIRRKQFSNKKLILDCGQLIFWPVKTIFSPFFKYSCQLQAFFRLAETSFSMNSFILTSGIGFPGQWKLFPFLQRFFFLVKTVTEISASQFLKKDHILTNGTDFLASGNHFLPIFRHQSTVAIGSNLFFNWNIFFSQFPHFGQWK